MSHDARAVAVLEAAEQLNQTLADLSFGAPVAWVLNPLDYAWPSYAAYVRRYARGRRRVLFMGMNPGPFGMMQTGIPFGEVKAVRDWLGIAEPLRRAVVSHPKRPIEGFDCKRSEVSGQRFWAWAAQRWGTADAFFADAFVLNWCPLAFLEASGRNFTPDKLPAPPLRALERACDAHLQRVAQTLEVEWALGLGAFAERRLRAALASLQPTIAVGGLLHPSPASPAANRGWAAQVDQQLETLGVFALPGSAP